MNPYNIFTFLNSETPGRNLSFLVIGGHAVNVYGYSRETADVDLLIPKGERTAWLSWFETLGYVLHNDGGVFLQMHAPPTGAWPLDFMLVPEDTFSKMMAGAGNLDYHGTKIRIPKVEHLLALKIHALKQAQFHRFLKDFQDVTGLIECSKLDPKSETVRQLFEKHGSRDLYEKVLHALS